MNKLMWPDVPPQVDKFTSIRWMAPSTLRLVTGICEPGEKAESRHRLSRRPYPDAGDRPDHALFLHRRALRRCRPRTRSSTGRSRRRSRTTRRFAFEEQDAPVIEAQQRIIDASQTAVDPLTLAIDVGPVRYKQVLKKLIAAEQAS